MHPSPDQVPAANDEPFNLSALERKTVVGALQHANGNKVRAAQLLGVSRRSLYRLIEKYRLDAYATPELEQAET
jgi:two-component system response regulator AtoC